MNPENARATTGIDGRLPKVGQGVLLHWVHSDPVDFPSAPATATEVSDRLLRFVLTDPLSPVPAPGEPVMVSGSAPGRPWLPAQLNEVGKDGSVTLQPETLPERRRCERRVVNAPAVASLTGFAVREPQPARLVDVSKGGARIDVSFDMEAGDIVELHCWLPEGQVEFRAVALAAAIDTGLGHIARCSFSRLPAETRAVLDQILAG